MRIPTPQAHYDASSLQSENRLRAHLFELLEVMQREGLCPTSDVEWLILQDALDDITHRYADTYGLMGFFTAVNLMGYGRYHQQQQKQQQQQQQKSNQSNHHPSGSSNSSSIHSISGSNSHSFYNYPPQQQHAPHPYYYGIPPPPHNDSLFGGGVVGIGRGGRGGGGSVLSAASSSSSYYSSLSSHSQPVVVKNFFSRLLNGESSSSSSNSGNTDARTSAADNEQASTSTAKDATAGLGMMMGSTSSTRGLRSAAPVTGAAGAGEMMVSTVATASAHRQQRRFRPFSSSFFRSSLWGIPLACMWLGYEAGLRSADPYAASRAWRTVVLLDTPIGEAARTIYAPPSLEASSGELRSEERYRRRPLLLKMVDYFLLQETIANIFGGSTLWDRRTVVTSSNGNNNNAASTGRSAAFPPFGGGTGGMNQEGNNSNPLNRPQRGGSGNTGTTTSTIFDYIHISITTRYFSWHPLRITSIEPNTNGSGSNNKGGSGGPTNAAISNARDVWASIRSERSSKKKEEEEEENKNKNNEKKGSSTTDSNVDYDAARWWKERHQKQSPPTSATSIHPTAANSTSDKSDATNDDDENRSSKGNNNASSAAAASAASSMPDLFIVASLPSVGPPNAAVAHRLLRIDRLVHENTKGFAWLWYRIHFGMLRLVS